MRAWLKGELPALLGAGVIDDSAAERLSAHYGLDELSPGVSRTLIAFAVMGGGLIGAGVILLLAHNWEEMSRPLRAGVCVTLLLVAQALAALPLLWPKARTEAFREGSALFLTASLGAALALVGQTYHAGGELGDLLFAWVALMIPLVYLLGARVTAGLLLLLALGLPLGRDHTIDEGYVFFGVLAALAPFAWRACASHPGERRTSWLALAYALSAAVGLALLVMRDSASALALALLVLAVVLRLAAQRLGQGVVGSLAALGLGVTSLVLTFESVIEELYSELYGWGHADLVYLVTLALVTVAVVIGLLRLPSERRREELALGAVLLPAWASYGLGFIDAAPMIGAVLFNVYVLALGLERLLGGLEAGDRRRSNFGLLMLSGLFLFRFFDSDLSFTLRGLGMMAVGAAFLAMNVYLGRRNPEGTR
jgi:uncharacterized membrane protein